jgi:hypothetical protein
VGHPREQIALSPPAAAHSLNEAVQKKRMSQSVLFLDSSRRSASTAHFPSGGLHP